ncbi:MAG: ABC transporter ATP-binding protein [Chloroflexales bacterium]|nr:ABC transporter ATP-binding protein [Chloroflexales bacterium]
MHTIEVDDLHKSYGSFSVLCGLTLSVTAGKVYGLLGPNGSGKSTFIHLLMGFLKPTSGKLCVLGATDPELVSGRIGYVPERLRYHTRYSAREYLHFLGKFSDMDSSTLSTRVDEELKRVGLSNAADRLLATYSKGMLQRLGVAQALLNDPDLLLIDEPTSGLDPAGQREVLDLLAEIRSRGHTIFLCTHYLDEIEYLCDRVGVLAHGRIAAEADVCTLGVASSSVKIQVKQINPVLQQRLVQIAPAVKCNATSITLDPSNDILQATVLRTLLDAEASIVSLEPLEHPLERFYLQAVRGEAPSYEPVTYTPSPSKGDTLLNELLRRTYGTDQAGRTDRHSPTNEQ